MPMNWNQVAQTEEFQALSPQQKQTVADRFFEQTVAAQLPPKKIEGAKQAWDQRVSPTIGAVDPGGRLAYNRTQETMPETESNEPGLIGDFGRSVSGGFIAGGGTMIEGLEELVTRGVNFLPGVELETNNMVSAPVKNYGESILEGRSEAGKQAVEDLSLVGEGGLNLNPRGLLNYTGEGVGSMGVLMIPGTAGAKAAGAGLKAAGASDKAARTGGAMIGYTPPGAALGGASQMDEVRNAVMNASFEDLADSPGFMEAYQAIAEQDSGGDQQAMLEQARTNLAERLANEAFPGGAVRSGVLYGLLGPYYDKLVKGTGGTMNNVRRGMTTEAVQESSDQGLAQAQTNQILTDIDGRPIMQDVVGRAFESGVFATLPGGLVGGALGPRGRAQMKEQGADDAVIDEVDAALKRARDGQETQDDVLLLEQWQDIQLPDEGQAQPEPAAPQNEPLRLTQQPEFTDLLVRANGNPFQTEKSAKASQQFRSNRSKGAQVIETEGGFAVQVPRENNAAIPLSDPEGRTADPVMGTGRDGFTQQSPTQPMIDNPAPRRAPTQVLTDLANAAEKVDQLAADGIRPKVTGETGTRSRVKLGDTYQDVDFMLVDLEQNPTIRPEFNTAANQNRDRTRAAYQEQVRSIAGNLDFNELGNSARMSEGAPTVTQEGVIIGGNGRIAAILEAYQRGTGDNYRQELQARANEFGLSPDAIGRMSQPALVRKFTNPVDVPLATLQSNVQTGARMSDLEQARIDGDLLTSIPELSADATGSINTPANRDFIRQFVASLPANERNDVAAADGTLSQSGANRLRNALLYRAYGDTDVLASLVEATDSPRRNILNTLVQSSPKAAQVRDAIDRGELYDLDIAAEIVDAVGIINDVAARDLQMSEYLAQGDLVGGVSDTAKDIARVFDAKKNSAKSMAEFINDYYDAVISAGNPNQSSLFEGSLIDQMTLLEQSAQNIGVFLDGRPKQAQAQAQAPRASQDRTDQARPDPGSAEAQVGPVTQLQQALYSDRDSIIDSNGNLTVSILDVIAELPESVSRELLNNNWADSVQIPLIESDAAKVSGLVNESTWYHGSPISDIDQLQTQDSGALFFASDRYGAESYADGGTIYERQLNVRAPFFVETSDLTADMESSGEIQKLKNRGFDSIVPLDRGDIVVLSDRVIQPQQETPDLTLQTQTEAELAQQASDQQAATQSQQAQQREADQRAAADAEASDFRLAGSDAAADVAAAGGQGNLLDVNDTNVVDTDAQTESKPNQKDQDGAFNRQADMRGMAFAVTDSSGGVVTSGTVPSGMDADQAMSKTGYYADMADQSGGALYVAPMDSQQLDTSTGEDLIIGMTWSQLEDKQQKIPVPTPVKTKMPDGAVELYRSESKPTQQSDAADQQLLNGEISIQEYLDNKGITESELDTSDIGDLRRDGTDEAKKNSAYHKAMDRISDTISAELKKAESSSTQTAPQRKKKINSVSKWQRASETLKNIERGFSHPFDNDFVSELPPLLKARHGASFKNVETGDAAKKAFRKLQYRYESEAIIARANEIKTEQNAGPATNRKAESKPNQETKKQAKPATKRKAESSPAPETSADSRSMNDRMAEMEALVKTELNGEPFTSDKAPDMMAAAWEGGDAKLNDMLTYLYRQRGGVKKAAQDELGMIAGFFEDSDVAELRNRAETARREFDGDDDKDAIANRMGSDLTGLELKHRDRDQYIVFLPDASDAGRFRISYYDANGFHSHQTRDTYQELLDEAFKDGFRIEAKGTLDKLANTADFQIGNESASLIGKLNSGEITHTEFAAEQERLGELRKKGKEPDSKHSVETNTGNGDLRYSRTEAGNRNLFVAHNLSATNLNFIDDLGGLAAPSLAVARSDLGFDNFGDITLIADKEILADPKAKTFDADVYTPRQPRAEFRINEKAYKEFIESLGETYGLSTPDMQDLSRDPTGMAYSDAVRLAYLRTKNQAPALKQQKVAPEIKKAASFEGNPYAMASDPMVQVEAAKFYKKDHARNVKSLADKGWSQQKIDDLLGQRSKFEEDGSLTGSAMREFTMKVQAYQDSNGVDVGALRIALSKKFRTQKQQNDLSQWAAEQFQPINDGAMLFKGFTNSGNRRNAPYTLANVVKEMTRTLQGGEDFNYGAGSVRAMYATRLKNLKQVQAKRDRIVSAEQMETVKEEASKKLEAALDALKPAYKFDADGFGYLNDASSAIAEGPQGWAEAFNLDADSRKVISDLVGYLRELPTDYFETKMQRAVQLNEFKVAIVPKGTNQATLDLLRRKGLRIRRYDPEKPSSRGEAVRKEEKLMFSRGQNKPGMKAASVQKIVDHLDRHWPGGINVVQSINDLPQASQDQIKADNATGVRGLLRKSDNSIWMIADNIESARDAERVLAHELVGHGGLRALFGADVNQVLDSLYGTEVTAEMLQPIVDNYNLDLDNIQQRREAVEEYIAHKAQYGNEKPGWFGRVIAQLRRLLRRMGFRQGWSDNDIMAVMASHKTASVDAIIAASRATMDNIAEGARIAAEDGGRDVMSLKPQDAAVFGPEAAKLARQAQALKSRVERAYEAGAKNATDLDAKLDGIYNRLEEIMVQSEEDGPTVDADNPAGLARQDQLAEFEPSWNVDLARRYAEIFVRSGHDSQGTRQERLERLRMTMEDIAGNYGGLKKGVTDQQIFEAAKDAYETTGARRTQGRGKLDPGVGRLIDTDSKNDLRYSRSGQTETPAFKKWFGKSKAVDSQGKPRVYYHGTFADVKEFRTTDEPGSYGTGIYFATNPDDASFWAGDRESQGIENEFGGNVVPVFLKIENPADGKLAEQMELDHGPQNIQRELEKMGYDGIIAPDEVVVFNPSQIKSTIGNSGQFNPQSDDLRFSINPFATKKATVFSDMASIDSHVKEFAKLRGFWDSASDVLRRVPKLRDVADAIDQFYDRTRERMGRVNTVIDPAFKAVQKLSRKEQRAVYLEFERYMRARENGRRQEAKALLNEGSQHTRDLVAAWDKVADISGRENQKLGVQVFDGKLNAWRPIGKLTNFWPRMMKQEVQEAILNPTRHPEMWQQMAKELHAAGRIESATIEAANEFLSKELKNFDEKSRNDYFAGIEKARSAPLPEFFYDYSWDAAMAYKDQWAENASRIEAFGQYAVNQSDLFTEATKRTMDKTTENYLMRVRDRVYNTRVTSPYVRIAGTLNMLATGIMLGNPATALLNLIGGTAINFQVGGTMTGIKGLALTLRNFGQNRLTAREKGILIDDYLTLLHDADQQGASKVLQKGVTAMLKYGGYTPMEIFIRTHGMVVGQTMLRDAMQHWNQNIRSKKSLNYLAWYKRNGFDYRTLMAENGQGPETDRLLRYTVNIGQGSYKVNQTPVFVDEPIGRFLFKYQKFGTQYSRLFWKNMLQPFVKSIKDGGETVQFTEGGKEYSARVKTFVPLIRFFGVGILAGTALAGLREALFGYTDPGPDFDEIEKALENDDTATAVALAFNRAWSSMMAIGTLGFFGNYLQMFNDVKDRQRVKSPIDPPALSIITNTGELALRFFEQGNKLTARDMDQFLTSTLSQYRTAGRLLERPGQAAGFDWAEVGMARRDRSYTRKMIRRYAAEMQIEAKRRTPDRFGLTEMSATNARIVDALLIGQTERARALMFNHLKDLKTQGEVDNALTSIRSAVRNGQPARVSLSPSQRERQDFLDWVKDRVGDEQYEKIRDLDDRYTKAAVATGLMTPTNPRDIARQRRNNAMAGRPIDSERQLRAYLARQRINTR